MISRSSWSAQDRLDGFGREELAYPLKILQGLPGPLKATQEQLAAALTGRFREVHAFEIATHLRLIDTINEEITRLDARIGQQLAWYSPPPATPPRGPG